MAATFLKKLAPLSKDLWICTESFLNALRHFQNSVRTKKSFVNVSDNGSTSIQLHRAHDHFLGVLDRPSASPHASPSASDEGLQMAANSLRKLAPLSKGFFAYL